MQTCINDPLVLSIFDLKKPHDFDCNFPTKGPILLELGAGKAEFACEMALSRPDWNFICVEMRAHRVRSIMKKLKRFKIGNVCILHARFEHLIPHCFFTNCIDEVYMNFPDPWIKSKQKNRRAMTKEFIDSVGSLLKIGGFFHFATDIEAYAEYAFELFDHSPSFKNENGETKFLREPGPHQETLFYGHAIKAGRIPMFLTFQRI